MLTPGTIANVNFFDGLVPLLEDAALPDVALPDVALPDAALLDVELPEAALLEVELPEAALPDVELPDVPEVELPDALPDVEPLEVELPEALPDVELPDVELAEAEPPDAALLDVPPLLPHADRVSAAAASTATAMAGPRRRPGRSQASPRFDADCQFPS